MEEARVWAVARVAQTLRPYTNVSVVNTVTSVMESAVDKDAGNGQRYQDHSAVAFSCPSCKTAVPCGCGKPDAATHGASRSEPDNSVKDEEPEWDGKDYGGAPLSHLRVPAYPRMASMTYMLAHGDVATVHDVPPGYYIRGDFRVRTLPYPGFRNAIKRIADVLQLRGYAAELPSPSPSLIGVVEGEASAFLAFKYWLVRHGGMPDATYGWSAWCTAIQAANGYTLEEDDFRVIH